jgi:hypothetical protein
MHHEFPLTDAPYPADPDVQFGAPPEQVTTELSNYANSSSARPSPSCTQSSAISSPKMVTALAVSVRSSTPWASLPF